MQVYSAYSVGGEMKFVNSSDVNITLRAGAVCSKTFFIVSRETTTIIVFLATVSIHKILAHVPIVGVQAEDIQHQNIPPRPWNGAVRCPTIFADQIASGLDEKLLLAQSLYGQIVFKYFKGIHS